MSAPARRMYSVPIGDAALYEYIDHRGQKHPQGVAGYFRDLAEADRQKWNAARAARKAALAKLTPEERAVLGYGKEIQP